MNEDHEWPDSEAEQLRRSVYADTPEDEARQRLQELFNLR